MISVAEKILGKKSDLAVVVITIAILSLLFTPMPSIVLDFFLVCNVSLSLLILMLTFYSDKPLSFSTFPSILLITTLFRLALNISATRLILDDGDAGEVIDAVGSYVVGGNYAVGVVVFIILIVVQYVVVTNGAQRVAEVAARFTLDSMPGKQMSIDADLNMGMITEQDAKNRRQEIQQEANFYGAMDGATKFVKGDAIAGIIIIFVDIVAGLMMGVGHHNMSWNEALSTYTLLTVGDGIVTQIPSLIIATATGIIITRAATDSKLGTEVVSQIIKHPSALSVLTITLFTVIWVPGLPKLPLIIMFLISLALAVYSFNNLKEEGDTEAEGHDNDTSTKSNEKEEIYKNIVISPIEVRFSQPISSALSENKEVLYNRVMTFRKQFALESGFVIPSVKLWCDDTNTSADSYEIYIQGAKVGEGEVKPKKYLVIGNASKLTDIKGDKTTEPTYGLPALWVEGKQSEIARNSGFTVVDWQTMLITHLSECIKTNSDQLLTRNELDNLFERNKTATETLVGELVPNQLSMSIVQKVLQSLMSENVSIRNITKILEILVDESLRTKNERELLEKVREGLSGFICQPLVNNEGALEVMSFDTEIERLLIQSKSGSERAAPFNLDPINMEKIIVSLVDSAHTMMSKHKPPVLVCSPSIRSSVKEAVQRVFPKLIVLAVSEVPNTLSIKSFATIKTKLENKMLEKSDG